MAEDINRIITDFVTFDIENDYYQKEEKDDLVRDFKKIVYHDDPTVRQWLKAVFDQAEKLADEYDLIAKEGEAEEEPVETEIEVEDTVEEPEEEVEDTVEEPAEEETADEDEEDKELDVLEPTKESVDIKKFYRDVASNLLY
jgi:hypothetical protein